MVAIHTWICRLVIWTYAGLYIVSLTLVPLSAALKPDALSGIFAVVLTAVDFDDQASCERHQQLHKPDACCEHDACERRNTGLAVSLV